MKKIYRPALWIAVSLLLNISAYSNEYCSVPPFLVKGVKPNVIIILDDSNSMDEDFFGNAVGSYSPKSKSVVAKKELIRIIQRFKENLRVGLVTYRLPDDVEAYRIHNAPYFVSYEPKSYCPDPPEECELYCKTGDVTYKTKCETACQEQNSYFDVDYFDEIITTYSIGSEQRNRYCFLVYPKTQRYENPVDPGNYLYYKKALPFYSSSNAGVAFCYSKDYNPEEGDPYDRYSCYKIKRGTSDDFEGYSWYWFTSRFYPTDSDYALGFLDFGRRLSWKYVGRTWYSNSSPGDGYIHVEVDDLVDSLGNETATYDKLMEKLDPKENDESGYMSCYYSDKNECKYIINAGLTPSAGTFQTVIDYLTGNNTPIEYRCQKTFVIYVTDGLPSVDEYGNTDTAENLLPAVLDKISTLRNLTVNIDGTDYSFDVKTYILGVALSKEAKNLLDQMAQKGGTAKDGHAYYADNPQELREGLQKIFEDIIKRVSSSASVATLSERSKSGALAVQAVFYPEKKYGDKKVLWIGSLYSYWFYNSYDVQNLREDSNQNYVLDKLDDSIIEFTLDENEALNINLYSPDSSGKKGTLIETLYSLDDIKYLFEAGNKLAETNPDNRKIFTTDGNSLINFSVTDRSKFEKYLGEDLNLPDCLGTDKKANLISYIRGEDISGCRNRSIDDYGSTWKLSDIIYSSPKVVRYGDFSVIFVGSNGGMLHAFKAGYMSTDSLSENQVAKLQNSKFTAGTDQLGEELWGFIPKNVLPYLRYLPDPDYCHMYFVDLTPYVFDYKDKKILIGGMRLGGACGCTGSNCINPPSDTCPVDGECVGLSSYFALDITDPENPKFMWEFTDSDLGFTFSGPGIIRKTDKAYVLFASGPTNYQGDSNQNLKLFILYLETGNLVRKIDTGIVYAFGGRLFTEGLDVDENGTTDYIALGYGRKDGDMNNWKGGLIYIDTRSELPDLWTYDKYLQDAQGPILTKVEFMRCFNRWYMYFGSGRWFYKTDNPLSGQRERLYGIPLDCSSGSCDPILSVADVTRSSKNVCTDAQNNVIRAWYIELDPNEEGYMKERSLTDPAGTTRNIVIFPTTQPTADLCGFGGRSRVWVLNCATGGALTDDCPSYPIKKAKGVVLLQLSGGDIKEVELKTFIEEAGKRTTQFFVGTLPEDSQQPIEAGIKSNKGEILLWLER